MGSQLFTSGGGSVPNKKQQFIHIIKGCKFRRGNLSASNGNNNNYLLVSFAVLSTSSSGYTNPTVVVALFLQVVPLLILSSVQRLRHTF